MRIRPSVFWLHRWGGLVASVIILVVAVTGCFLAFEEELDRAMHPALYKTARSDVAHRN
ncbi:MAG: PepSY-associated TM helix domain-containing protein [Sulfuricaulis sp.]|nr:PepSY-associated TM helix domain-containing protein [Sulfuricaulis sp.]